MTPVFWTVERRAMDKVWRRRPACGFWRRPAAKNARITGRDARSTRRRGPLRYFVNRPADDVWVLQEAPIPYGQKTSVKNASKNLSFFIVWSPKCGGPSASKGCGLHTIKKLLELNPRGEGAGALGFGRGYCGERRRQQAATLRICPWERWGLRASQGVRWAEKATRQ